MGKQRPSCRFCTYPRVTTVELDVPGADEYRVCRYHLREFDARDFVAGDGHEEYL